MLMYKRDMVVNFKEIYTTNVKSLSINSYWTINEFIKIMTPLLREEFNTSRIDIIECGLKDAENAHNLHPSDSCMRDIWNENELKLLSFYVRKY